MERTLTMYVGSVWRCRSCGRRIPFPSDTAPVDPPSGPSEYDWRIHCGEPMESAVSMGPVVVDGKDDR